VTDRDIRPDSAENVRRHRKMLDVLAQFRVLFRSVRRHYQRVRAHLASLDETLLDLPLPTPKRSPELATDGPTAIVLVDGYSGLGIHAFLSVQRLMPGHYRNVVFVSVGLVDSAQFKGVGEVEALEHEVRSDLEQYLRLAERMGVYAEYRLTLGTDLVDELEAICLDLIKEFRRPVVFAGQLVFQRENLFTRSLHHETAVSLQRRLQFAGIQVIILPIRVWDTTGAPGSERIRSSRGLSLAASGRPAGRVAPERS